MPDFPIPTMLNTEIYDAAVEKNTSDYLPLWCGQSISLALDLPAQKLMEIFVSEAEKTLKKFAP